jgi:hypothetical protein
MNIGEQICGDWLKHKKGCEFISYNLKVDHGGEIDVIGIDIDKRHVYVCEVAIHLITGIQYSNPKTKKPDNVNRFTNKFTKNCDYAESHFPDYKIFYMLWTPIVRNQKPDTKHHQMDALNKVVKNMKRKRGIDIELVVNHLFMDRIIELRKYAKAESKALDSPVMRFLQIESKLLAHIAKLDK